VGLVDQQAAAVATGEIRELRERRDVAVHREDPVGRDQGRATGRPAQAPFQMLDVGVPVDEGLRPRQPAAVDDAGVVEGVREDHLATLRQRRDRSAVGEVARAEQQGRLGSLELGQPRLELAVDRHRAGDQPGRPGARPELQRRIGGGAPQPGMVCQSQIVVRAEHQDRAAVEHHLGALGPLDHAQATPQPARFELSQPFL
jgi:hypothetical protein